MGIVRLKTIDGQDIAFRDEVCKQGGMKDVFFATDRSYVVAFFREKQDANTRERLQSICGSYRERIFNQVGGQYWKKLFCWPTAVVEHQGLLGLVAPVYDDCYFFKHGSVNDDFLDIRGGEKEGKWFASALHQNRWLDPRERGDWRGYFRVCILTCRAVRRMHAAGLAHSDLSYKNVLIDPSGGAACIIDIDGLVVPGKFPPGVVGTPDFIAPEVMASRALPVGDPKKALPRRETDQHALGVLIYMYLLHRHPLRGRKVHDMDDTERDEWLAMGERALFIEHPQDDSNRYTLDWVKRNYGSTWQYLVPQMDLHRLPFTVLGPYLAPLMEQSFVQGLHAPTARPTADDWETALIKTVDLMQPCANAACSHRWFVYDNTTRPRCPFCGTAFHGVLPILNLYSKRGETYKPDNHRLTVYHDQYLYPWHVSRNVFPNERLADADKAPVGYFKFHGGNWLFCNQTLPNARDVTEDKPVPPNSYVVLSEGKQVLLSPEDGGRIIQVQLVSC